MSKRTFIIGLTVDIIAVIAWTYAMYITASWWMNLLGAIVCFLLGVDMQLGWNRYKKNSKEENSGDLHQEYRA